MADLGSAALVKLSIHSVGNKGNGGVFLPSRIPIQLKELDKQLIKQAFLEKFSFESDKYKFHHLSSLDYNEVYNYCLQLFAEEKEFHQQSISIARHLFESSTHPKIKDGELYIAYFENCDVNGAYIDAIGIFKTETKSNFIDLDIEGSDWDFTIRKGVELTKFDKGCLIFPTNAEQGFDILTYDTNRGEEAVFWRETFLNIVPQATEFFQTNEFLTLTKQFIAKQIPQEFEITKTDQIDLLNKSVEYFRANTEFNKGNFEKEVLQDSSMIKSFRQFGDTYSEENDIDLPERFDISTFAVKKQARVFKSVLKLDKNFHIYIHGDKDLIEKGYDAHVGKSYYKIYFDEES